MPRAARVRGAPTCICFRAIFAGMFSVLDNLRRQRLFVVAIALAAFAQLGMAAHEVLAEHSLGELCEVCVAQDRLDDSVPVAGIPATSADTHSFVFVPTAAVVASNDVAAVRNRGPPRL